MTQAVPLSPPNPELTAQLASEALLVYRRDGEIPPVPVEDLRILAASAPAAWLSSWAEEIATPTGFQLLGTGLMAPTYPALLWNGARLDAACPNPDWAPLLAALAAGQATDCGMDRIGRALAAADWVRRQTAQVCAAELAPVARPTLATLAAATAAALTGPSEGDDLVRVLDLAASLTVLTPGVERRTASPLWTGHGAASGWLAAALPVEAVTPMLGTVAHTLSVAAGRPLGGGEPAPSTVAQLLEALR